ncbi:MAG TPA: hypothetical protein VGE74_10395 [Gemmata sp.]
MGAERTKFEELWCERLRLLREDAKLQGQELEMREQRAKLQEQLSQLDDRVREILPADAVNENHPQTTADDYFVPASKRLLPEWMGPMDKKILPDWLG